MLQNVSTRASNSRLISVVVTFDTFFILWYDVGWKQFNASHEYDKAYRNVNTIIVYVNRRYVDGNHRQDAGR